ncbi:MAG: tetratricopeptide repeat protein [Proteobacteria bacterium]|nr:tetratricopeptide repeat protein [Pseudomonadota bacterium]
MNIEVKRLQPLEQHLVAGGDFLRQNRVEEARQELEAALRIDPDNLKVLGLLGLACFRMDDFKSAFPVYQKLVALDRNDASFSLNLGLVHLRLGNSLAAIGELKRSRELDPSQSRAVSYLGLAYARNGDYKDAFQAFLQAGEVELAREMEQYLSAEQRRAIEESIANKAREQSVNNPAAADAPKPAPASLPAPTVAKNPQAHRAGPAGKPSGQLRRASPQTGRKATRTTDSLDAVEIQNADLIEVFTEIQAQQAHEVELDLDYDDVELIAEEDLVETAAVVRAGVPGEGLASPFARAREADQEPTAAAAASSRPRPEPGRPGEQRPGIISQAVERATPSTAATAGAAPVAVGHKPPQSLTEFATSRLIRPEDGEYAFETSAAGVLIIRVDGRVYSRTEGVSITGGELAYEVALRRSRGSSTSEDFSSNGRRMFIISGHGHLIAAPLGEHFTAVTLDEDILYLREDLVFAFEDQLRWENGHVPGSEGAIAMVQFRGQGSIAFRTQRPLLAIKLAPEHVLYIDAQVLAGWIGRVMPRAVAPAAGGSKSTLFVECTGEGVVLVEEQDVEPGRGAVQYNSERPGGDLGKEGS